MKDLYVDKPVRDAWNRLRQMIMPGIQLAASWAPLLKMFGVLNDLGLTEARPTHHEYTGAVYERNQRPVVIMDSGFCDDVQQKPRRRRLFVLQWSPG